MSQSGYTPILIYASGTTTNVPLAANLTSSASGAELALNYADGKLFYKDSGGTVQVLATKGTGPIGGSTTQVQYNNAGVLAGSANLTFDGTTLTANNITSASATNLVLKSAGTTAITVDTSQNVGIGTSSPSYKVEMAITSGSNFYSATTSATGQDIGYRLASTATGGREYRITTSDPTRGGNTNSLAFVDQTAGAARMLIDSSGNVGIGTTTTTINDQSGAARPFVVASSDSGTTVGGFIPSLNVVNTNTTTNNGAQLNFASTYTSGGINTSSAYVGAIFGARTNTTNYYAAGTLVFGTSAGGASIGPAERMRIDSSGNLLLATTSQINPGSGTQAGINLNAIGQIVGSVNSDTNYFRRTGTDGNLMVFYKVNSAVGGISVTASATAYATSSDYRLKENIMPMTGGLAKVSALKPVTYKWKADGSDGQGFIAHELAEVVPQCVIGEKDAIDADGNPVYQGIDTSFLVATLTAAIQELKALTDAQASTITALTARITALETK